jgi:hypothetical protein
MNGGIRVFIRNAGGTTRVWLALAYPECACPRVCVRGCVQCAMDMTNFPFKKRVTPDNLVGYSESAKAAQIQKVFEDAYRTPLSIIILDDIERLIGARP